MHEAEVIYMKTHGLLWVAQVTYGYTRLHGTKYTGLQMATQHMAIQHMGLHRVTEGYKVLGYMRLIRAT